MAIEGIRISVKGDKKLARKLNKLDVRHRNRVLKPAVTKAITPWNKQIKARAPVDSGAFKKAVAKGQTRIYKEKGVTYGIVGIRSKFEFTMDDGKLNRITDTPGKRNISPEKFEASGKTKRKPAKYLHLVEFHNQSSRLFMTKVFNTTKREVERNLSIDIARGIRRLAR